MNRRAGALVLRLGLGLLWTQSARAEGIGGVGPTLVAATAQDGSWAILCQARKDTDGDGRLSVTTSHGGSSGDQQQAYLVLGSGEGTPIDDFLGADPTGRRALIERNKRTFLIQPGLGPDLDLTRLGARGLLQFDESGERLAYAKPIDKKDRIVVRDLTTGREHMLDPGPGKLDSFSIEPGGSFLRASVFALRKGDIPWRTTASSSPRWCWTGFVSDSVRSSGTPPVTRLIPMAGGGAREIPDLIGVLGDAWLRRAAGGEILAERPGAAPQVLVPAACGGIVVARTPAPGTLLVACKKRGTPAPLEIYGSGDPRSVGATITPSTSDSLREVGRYLLVSGRDANDTIIDLTTSQIRHSPTYQMPIAHSGELALVQRGETLVVLSPQGDRVLGAIARYPLVLRAGSTVYVEPLVADLTTGTLVGTTPQRKPADPLAADTRGTILGLARDGRVLVGFGAMQGRWGFVPGPLEWLRPAPPPTPVGLDQP